MVEQTLEQIRHRRQSDMRVRANIDAVTGQELRRAHLVEKDEWADHLALWRWQGAAHFEIAQIARTGHDDGFNGIHGIAGWAIGIKGGVPAHVDLQSLSGCGKS